MLFIYTIFCRIFLSEEANVRTYHVSPLLLSSRSVSTVQCQKITHSHLFKQPLKWKKALKPRGKEMCLEKVSKACGHRRKQQAACFDCTSPSLTSFFHSRGDQYPSSKKKDIVFANKIAFHFYFLGSRGGPLWQNTLSVLRVLIKSKVKIMN